MYFSPLFLSNRPGGYSSRLYKRSEQEAACGPLVRAGALWMHATWKEFLKEEVVKTSTPEAYRPLTDDA